MYEVVKVVKGHEIKRMKGTRGVYRVSIREHEGKDGAIWREFQTFRTIKAAAAFIEATF